MANRFLDNNYYKSPFVRRLKGSLKSLYSYIICDCDGTGIWNIDLAAASMYIGFDVSPEEFDEFFVKKGKAILVGDGKYFFPDFIEHQYPHGLNKNNPAHKNFISTLKKFDLINEDGFPKIERPFKAPLMGLKSHIGNGNGIGNGQGTGTGNSFGKSENLFDDKFLIGKMISVWVKKFPAYSPDPDHDSEALRKISDFMFKQHGIKNGYGNAAHEIMCLDTFEQIACVVETKPFWLNKPIKAIANNIQEFYNEIKNPIDGRKQSSSKTGNKPDLAKVQEAHARHYGGGKQG